MTLVSIAIMLALVFGFGRPVEAAQAGGLMRIFVNGTIHLDAKRTATNLVVQDGKVMGFDVDLQKHSEAEVVDLQGGVVYPGFNDSHCHLMEAGSFLRIGVDLSQCTDAKCIAEAMRKKAVTLKGREDMLLGIGFSLENYDAWSLADLAQLDSATGDHPTFLMDKLGHNVLVNSATMALTGIKPGTTPPPGGKIVEENGKPTGMLRESAALLAGNAIYARLDAGQVKAGTLELLRRWASMGYTAIIDMMGSPSGRIMQPEVFREMEQEGSLPLRINYMYTIYKLDDVEDALKYAGKDTDMVRFTGVKLFVDGAYAGGLAWTTWLNAQGGHGLHYVDGDDAEGDQYNLDRIVQRIEKCGLNAHYHVQGDAGIKALLNALDRIVSEQGALHSTHTIIHLAFPTPEQIERIKRFEGKVVTTVQPAFWVVESDADHYYGKRAPGAYPIKKLIDAGISVGMSTDFSVSPLSHAPPTMIMKVAATESGPGRKPVSVPEVVHGLTVGSAANTAKSDIGILDVGYKADMVVYDRELFTSKPEGFDKDVPKVLSTWIGGRKVEIPR